MEEAFNLEEYLAASVEKMVKSIVKTSLFCPKEEIFMEKYALASKAAAEKRKNMAGRGDACAAISDCEHYQPVQPALQRLLCAVGEYL